jgi:hypothetical protein
METGNARATMAERLVPCRFDSDKPNYVGLVASFPLKGEGWDEGDTPLLNPLPPGERKFYTKIRWKEH